MYEGLIPRRKGNVDKPHDLNGNGTVRGKQDELGLRMELVEALVGVVVVCLPWQPKLQGVSWSFGWARAEALGMTLGSNAGVSGLPPP